MSTAIAVKERPILFSGAMVKAILEGRKTQTRRVIAHPEYHGCLTGDCPHSFQSDCDAAITEFANVGCPYGGPGDRLWLRETFLHSPATYCYEASVSIPCVPAETIYAADVPGGVKGAGFTPGIFMSRHLSRITLEITKVRVQGVQDITEQDARAEGANCYPEVMHADEPLPEHPYRNGFLMLWNSINAKRGFGWDANPWVWVIEFKRVQP